MIVKIDNLSHDFKGITRVGDKVTFVSKTLPGEVVSIKLLEEKKKYNLAIVNDYIEKSSDRVIPKCPYFDRCGGCDICFIKYDRQLEYKKNIVIDIFKKYANMEINPDIITNNNVFGYRNKITLRVLNNHLALYEEDSNNLVNISKCLLVNDNINDVIEVLNTISLEGINEVIIRGDKEIMLIINGNCDYKNIISLLKDRVSSIIYNNKVIYGNEYINIKVGNYNYRVYPDSFFQVNTDMIKLLYDRVKEYAGIGSSLLDLYCGAGTIGIYLSSNFKSVHGIEINRSAIKGANINKEINSIGNISFIEGTTSDVKEIKEDVVIVDPPRSGLDDKTREALIKATSKRIVYVSCNPITLARDINILKDYYNFKDIVIFDNFPNTKHVESIVLLERK